MRKLLILLALIFACVAQAQVTFSGNTLPVIKVKPAPSTGLDMVYVLNSTQGVLVTYDGIDASWQQFSMLGGGFAEPIPGVTQTLRQVTGNMGYIITPSEGKPYYFWVVDYSQSPMVLNALEVMQSDCSSLTMAVNGSAAVINYYTINGQAIELDRDIQLSFNTERYDESRDEFVRCDTVMTFKHLSPELYLPAPLCDTELTLEGDQFLRVWGKPQSVTSSTVQATAVDCHVTAEQTPRDNDNETGTSGGDALGGSAPAEITFTAAVSSACEFTEWQIAPTPDFENIDLRYQQTQVTHTFRDMGDYYARFVCANADGSCEQTSETYQIQIGESMLQCPNVFSPGTSEGVNDEWKVAYKSIVSFECHIFNRNGVKIISLTDPSQGWDGKYNGKLVPTGVYYYVIKARGSDGRKYELGGDINILNYK